MEISTSALGSAQCLSQWCCMNMHRQVCFHGNVPASQEVARKRRWNPLRSRVPPFPPVFPLPSPRPRAARLDGRAEARSDANGR